ncbi:MAG TPA: nuclear transport factor 2 family protein [Chitinophagaceae bacterium]|nr:nuclear transport factor 2 family protein [Chitinophagaceae bacterium]
MRRFLLFLTILVSGNASFAQSAEDSVKTTVNTLFTAMKNADASLLKSVFADSAILQTITRDKEGKLVVRNEDVKEFVDFVGQQKKDVADERIEFGTIKIDGPLAIVWTPYQFYFSGKFSHCGVNSFQLVRFDNGWKIQYLVDTRRKTGCEPAK